MDEITMQLQSAYVTTIDICRTKEDFARGFVVYNDLPERTVFEYRSDNLLLGSHLFYDISDHIPNFWKEITNDALFRCQAIPGYLIFYYLFEIYPENFSHILHLSNNDPYEYDKKIEELIEILRSAAFQSEHKSRINSFYHGKFSFAHLIPKHPIIIDTTIDDTHDLVCKVNDYLGLSDSAALPSEFRGCLFFHHPTISHPDDRGIIVSLRSPTDKFNNNDHKIYSTFVDYYKFRAYSWICADLSNRLGKSIFNHSDIEHYTKEVYNANSLDTGQKKIINDRMKTIRLRSRIKDILNSLSQEMKGNYFRHLDSPASHRIIELLNRDSYSYSRRWGFLTKYEKRWDNLTRFAKDRITETKENEEIFSDYLRDLVIAKSTSASIALQNTNLTLQKSVRILTIIATLLAIFGLSVSLLPEQEKDALFYFIVDLVESLADRLAPLVASIFA